MANTDHIMILATTIFPDNLDLREYRIQRVQMDLKAGISDSSLVKLFKTSKIYDSMVEAEEAANTLDKSYGGTKDGILLVTHKGGLTFDELETGRRYNRSLNKGSSKVKRKGK